MKSADLVVRGCARVLTAAGPVPKRGPDMADPGAVADGWIAAREGRLVFVGSEARFREEVEILPGAEILDGEGCVALPGFVDAHTHLPFAGNREAEFGLRVKGWTYRQLAEQGLGIKTTVRATRAAAAGELLALCLGRLDRMLLTGTTTVEAKSGYGLNLEDEIKQLEVLREADRRHPVDIVPTFMGAHDVPPEFAGRTGAYVGFLVETVLPEVRARGLAEFFDVFCEEGAFSLEDTRRLIDAARAAGLGVKVHADEFVPLGGARLAARSGAVSAEHLIAVTDEGIAALAASDTAAVLLPGVPFFLMQAKRPPARRLVEAGAAVALATDFNPGSSMLSSMLFVLQLGVFTLGLSVEEAINACTANAAYAIRRHGDRGTLEPGKLADVCLWAVADPVSLAYNVAAVPLRHVIKRGRVVVRDGCPAWGTVQPPGS